MQEQYIQLITYPLVARTRGFAPACKSS